MNSVSTRGWRSCSPKHQTARAFHCLPSFDLALGTRGDQDAFWIIEGAEYCGMG
jgi:hypothetical protein